MRYRAALELHSESPLSALGAGLDHDLQALEQLERDAAAAGNWEAEEAIAIGEEIKAGGL
jgi:hypothetical protein